MSKAPIFNHESEDFSLYIERLELYFKIEKVDEDLKKSHLCVNLPPQIYAELKPLLSPIEFNKATFKQCVEALSQKYTKTKKVIAERYKFNNRKQQIGELITDYITEIKTLASNCQFASFFDQALRDRLVSGLLNTNIVSRLLSEDETLTFDKACQIVFNMEAVEDSARVIAGSPPDSSYLVSKVRQSRSPYQQPHSTSRNRRNSPGAYNSLSPHRHYGYQKSPNIEYNKHSKSGKSPLRKSCYYCFKKHQPQNCPAKKWICHSCGKEGHVAGFCNSFTAKKYVNFVNKSSSCLVSNILNINLSINGTPTQWLVDTGSSVSVMCAPLARKLQLLSNLSPFLGILRGVNGQELNILGTCYVQVGAFNSISHLLPLVVVEELSCNAILGRDWLSVLSPNWSTDIFGNNSLSENNVNVVEQKSCTGNSKSQTVQELSKQFPRVFSLKCNDEPIKTIKVNVNLKDNVRPVFHKPYTVPYALRAEVSQELSKLESDGIISKVSHSDWASPTVIVPKANGKIRMCVDFKVTLNRHLKVDQHPIPTPDDIFNQFTGCTVFCRLDLSQAYLQLEVHENSKDLLVINTIRGLYRYNRLPFGLASACAIFQSVIESILSCAEHTAPYLDDILIGGKDLNECKQNLNFVLSRLEEYNVKLNVEKSEFFVSTLVFLGFELTTKGKAPSATKVQQILSMPPPTNLSQLKSFVSMFNYYRSFVHMCPDILEPFYELMRKDVPFVWSSKCSLAFIKCKTALSEATMLILFDPSKDLILSVDSSSFGVGAILSQVHNGKELPIAFESATLSPAQRNYSQLEKEGLAVIFGLKKFHKYLWGREFTIFSDHLPLKTLFGESKRIPNLASSKLIRWASILSAYQYKIAHKKGNLIPHVDALSRLPVPTPVGDNETFFTYLSTPLISLEEISNVSKSDPILTSVMNYLTDGFPKKVSNDLTVYAKNSHCLSIHNGCLFFGTRVVIPISLRDKVLKIIHFSHSGHTRSKLFARSYVWWPSMDNDIGRFIAMCSVCQATQNRRNNQWRESWPKPRHAWERVHVDLFDFNNRKFLIICDSFSKWIECFVLRSKSDYQAVISKLAEVFARFSFPKTIVCDNGPPFCSKEMKDFCIRKGIKLMYTPPYSPQSNGLAERSVQTFKILLSKFYLSHRSSNLTLDQMLLECLFGYRTMPTSVTGKSPMAMLLTFEPNTPLSQLRKLKKVKFQSKTINNNVQQKSYRSDNSYKCKDKKTMNSFCVNELVWVNQNKKLSQGIKYVLGNIVRKLSNTVYIVKLPGDITRKVHINQLRKYFPGTSMNQTYNFKPHIHVRESPSGNSQSSQLSKTPSPPKSVIVSPNTTPARCSPVPSASSSPNQTVSPHQKQSRTGRVIRPPKRFTFSEFDP